MPHAIVRERQRGRAKQLRQLMTPAETLLWRYLKASRVDGLGFRRQTPIRNYIVDFVCHSAKVIIELDGASHDFEEQQKADEKRDAFFVSEGFRVLRFTNEQVMSNLEGVVETIRQVVSSRASGLPPSLTLPHKGGGNGLDGADITENTSSIRGSQP
jgi:very-short-patch-repair endonuclease